MCRVPLGAPGPALNVGRRTPDQRIVEWLTGAVIVTFCLMALWGTAQHLLGLAMYILGSG